MFKINSSFWAYLFFFPTLLPVLFSWLVLNSSPFFNLIKVLTVTQAKEHLSDLRNRKLTKKVLVFPWGRNKQTDSTWHSKGFGRCWQSTEGICGPIRRVWDWWEYFKTFPFLMTSRIIDLYLSLIHPQRPLSVYFFFINAFSLFMLSTLVSLSCADQGVAGRWCGDKVFWRSKS